MRLPLGPLMIDIAGKSLTDDECRRLCHPLVGGLILFARNYDNPGQLAELCNTVHALRSPALPIAIDHEGGRVQRCRNGFSRLPAMRRLGQLWDKDASEATHMAEAVGFILAAELLARGVDLSFTPVLDLDWGQSEVIGDRAFHGDPDAVISLAGSLIKGLHRAGMVACGKHFPGHGWVQADSHVDFPVDTRSLAQMEGDIRPYRALELDAVMPAHVVYSNCDDRSAGFSNFWLSYLRQEIGFKGVIFSDDLSMRGATAAGDIVTRATAAYEAGCDVLLVCNMPSDVARLLTEWEPDSDSERSRRRERLSPSVGAEERATILTSEKYTICMNVAAPLLAPD